MSASWPDVEPHGVIEDVGAPVRGWRFVYVLTSMWDAQTPVLYGYSDLRVAVSGCSTGGHPVPSAGPCLCGIRIVRDLETNRHYWVNFWSRPFRQHLAIFGATSIGTYRVRAVAAIGVAGSGRAAANEYVGGLDETNCLSFERVTLVGPIIIADGRWAEGLRRQYSLPVFVVDGDTMADADLSRWAS